MKNPEKPLDETQRLRALHSLNILDTPQDERFDRLTRLAKRIFDVPIALVTFIDDERQWVKSCAGVEVSEMHRDISFCGHAILGDEVLVIPDMSKDPRFSGNPLVTGKEASVSFYAGCPIKSLDGSKLGTLCIVDEVPREFSDDDCENLKDLAAMVERELSVLELATMDDLTGLLNRRGFSLLAENNLELARRDNISVCLVFFDLDDFKSINDNFGHAEGDEALIKFSELLSIHSRQSDSFARMGGDEFVGLLMNSDKESSVEIIERVRKDIHAYNSSPAKDFDIVFSEGVVQFDKELHKTLDDLISEGDRLMYQKKKNTSKRKEK